MASSKQFSWNDISVVILGKTIVGLLEIEYKLKQEKEYAYGRGSDPHSIQSGNKSVKGKFVMLQSDFDEFEATVKAVDPTLDITDVAFDAVWSFEKSDKVLTEIIQGIELEIKKRTFKQGDKFGKIELPFMALKVIPG